MSPTLRKKLSRPREIEAKTVRKRLTIFFSDLVGFTKMSEDLDPSDLNYVLNSYVTEVSNVAIEYGASKGSMLTCISAWALIAVLRP